MGIKLKARGLEKFFKQRVNVSIEDSSLNERPIGQIHKRRDNYFVGRYKIREGMTLKKAYFPRENSGSESHRYTGMVQTFTVDLG